MGGFRGVCVVPEEGVGMAMKRRGFLLTGLGVAAAAGAATRLRVGVMGDTGHGNYGHGVDTVWGAVEQADVVAVADPDAEGREKARVRLGAERGYADYRRMLEREELDVVSVCPRWMDQRVEMVTAAAEAGCHIYSEKPFAATLADADRMVEAVRRSGVKLQLAHQMRRSPYTLAVKRLIEAGAIGDVQEVRTRGKEDRRAGGEDLMVLGSHVCDVMRMLLGDPEWVFAHVTEDGEELAREDVREGSEPIGPIGGREIAAMFSFGGGVHGYFGSKRSEGTAPWRFGTTVYGSKGVIFLPNAIYPGGEGTQILRSAGWVPDGAARWEPVAVEHDRRFDDTPMMTANLRMVEDLLAAIAEDREPVCSERAGLWTTEMITGIYRSQVEGGVVRFPQGARGAHPLSAL